MKIVKLTRFRAIFSQFLLQRSNQKKHEMKIND